MGTALEGRCRPSFARHETFHPRFGWLKKAFDEANRESGARFADEDAPVRLGVGKNMVHAIRHWGLAFKVLEEVPDPERPRIPRIVPSEFGRALFANDGWDPYLEQTDSLWLLHWQLLRPVCLAPTWWVAFNALPQWSFSEEDLQARVVELSEGAGWSAVVAASIKKDIDCVIRTYTIKRQGRQSLDDVLDCPFRELGLIERGPDATSAWRIVYGDKPTLSPHVVLFAALDFVAQQRGTERSITIARLASDPGGPGRAFGLREADLHRSLAAAVHGRRDLDVAEPGGLRQLLINTDDVQNTADRVAAQIFNGRVTRVSA